MSTTAERIIALGFDPGSTGLLRQLEGAVPLAAVHWPRRSDCDPLPGTLEDHVNQTPSTAAWLEREWPGATAVVAVGACGLVIRLIAPLLRGKHCDPAVVVMDPTGRFAIPLLGGHAAGGEKLARRLAALVGGEAVLTGGGACAGRIPLDSFGHDWGWIRGDGDWSSLMAAASRGTLAVDRHAGNPLWLQLAGAMRLHPGPQPSLVVSHRRGSGCFWHPPCLWLGLGCERNTSNQVLERLVESTLAEHGLAAEAVAGLASVDRKGDEPALLALAERRGWPLRLFPAEALAVVAVPNPSQRVAREMGTASVAEAAALVAAASADGSAPGANDRRLLVPKRIGLHQEGERGAATLAVALAERQWAPQRGELNLVGIGPGPLELLSGEARSVLGSSAVWVGYASYLDLLEPLRRSDQLRRDGRLTEERERCAEALELAAQGVKVALISSGDSGIYGMAGLALELWLELVPQDRPAFSVHPGLSALQLAAARIGAPLMHDFCVISLSDRLTPWEVIEKRLRAAGEGDFVIALYNPRSKDRHWQLGRARELLLEDRSATTPVLIARQLGRAGEDLSLHTLESLPVDRVDMLTLVLIGNSTTRVRDGRMVTPRGYPGAAVR